MICMLSLQAWRSVKRISQQWTEQDVVSADVVVATFCLLTVGVNDANKLM